MVGRRSAGGGDRRPRPEPCCGAACAVPGVRAVLRERNLVMDVSRFDQRRRRLRLRYGLHGMSDAGRSHLQLGYVLSRY